MHRNASTCQSVSLLKAACLTASCWLVFRLCEADTCSRCFSSTGCMLGALQQPLYHSHNWHGRAGSGNASIADTSCSMTLQLEVSAQHLRQHADSESMSTCAHLDQGAARQLCQLFLGTQAAAF